MSRERIAKNRKKEEKKEASKQRKFGKEGTKEIKAERQKGS